MKTFLKFIFIAVLLLTTSHLQAQTTVYPIQLNAVMLPPYTNCLGDYFNSGANRAQVKAILRDISRYGGKLNFSLSVKVKQGNTVLLESKTPYPISLTNANVINDLRDYVRELFSPRSVTYGGNYDKNGYCLPEGVYEFVFQAFDFYKRNMPLSEPFSMFCSLRQAEPPVLVYPEDGACGINNAIGLSDQGVQFQWMDPIAYGPSNKVYEFVLTEKSSTSNLVSGMFSDASASENPLNLPVYNEKIYNNTFRYIPATSGILQKGNDYCWYVVAKGENLGDGNTAFKNGGKSKTNCFTYGDCPAKEEFFDNSKVKKVDHKLRVVLEKVDVDNDNKTAEAFWRSENGDFCKYYVYYYRKDLTDASAEKAEIDGISSLSTVLKNLEPGKEYVCYVVGATHCNKEIETETLSPKSNEYTFKLAEIKMGSDNCDALGPMACENLLETLDVKDYFYGTTNSEIITVTDVTKNPDNSFSGKGIVSCTLLRNKVGLNVTFQNIKINSDRYLCNGEVKVVHDDTDNMVFNLNEFAGKKQGADKAKQQEEAGKEVKNQEEAKQHPNEVVFIGKDVYVVDEKGNPEPVGEVKQKDDLCDLPSSGLYNEDGVIVFDVEKGLNGEKYDPYIDKSSSPFTAELVKKGYEWQSSNYPIPWIAMVEGECRYITASIAGKSKQAQSSLNIKDVEFYCYAADGSAVKLVKEPYKEDMVKLKIYGGVKNTSLKIYACKNVEKVNGQCPEEDVQALGVANVYTMSHQTKKVMLAPVLNEMTLNNLQQMQDEVNEKFAPLGKKFEFTKGQPFLAENDSYLKMFLEDGLNTYIGERHFTKETDEMRYIRQNYIQYVSDFSDYDACLFLIPTAQKEGLEGYMPLNKSVGYIVVGEDSNVELDANTIAHELCHGLYDIQHVFNYNGVSEGDLPENIMDYPKPDANVAERYLTKYYQWVGIENGQLIHLSFLDDTEDAELGSVLKCLGKAGLKVMVSKFFEKLFSDEKEKEEEKGVFYPVLGGFKDFVNQAFDDCTEEFGLNEKGWKAAITAIETVMQTVDCFTKEKTTTADCLCGAGIDAAFWFFGDFASWKLQKKYGGLSDEEKQKVKNKFLLKIYDLKTEIEEISKIRNNSAPTYFVTEGYKIGSNVFAEKCPLWMFIDALLTGNTKSLKKFCSELFNDDSGYNNDDNNNDINNNNINNGGSQNQTEYPSSDSKKKAQCSTVSFDIQKLKEKGLPLPSDAYYQYGRMYFKVLADDRDVYEIHYFNATIQNCSVQNVAISENTIWNVDNTIYVKRGGKIENINDIAAYTIIGNRIIIEKDVENVKVKELQWISDVYTADKCLKLFVAASTNWFNNLSGTLSNRKNAFNELNLEDIWKKLDTYQDGNKFLGGNMTLRDLISTLEYDETSKKELENTIKEELYEEDEHNKQLKIIIRTVAQFLSETGCSAEFLDDKKFNMNFPNIGMQSRVNTVNNFRYKTNEYYKQYFDGEIDYSSHNKLEGLDNLLSEFYITLCYKHYSKQSYYDNLQNFLCLQNGEDIFSLFDNAFPNIIRNIK